MATEATEYDVADLKPPPPPFGDPELTNGWTNNVDAPGGGYIAL
jgi:hypothetical protein